LFLIDNNFWINYSLHQTQPLLATTSGQRHNYFNDVNEETLQVTDIKTDISLKIWKII